VSFFFGPNFKSYSFNNRILSEGKIAGNLYLTVDNYNDKTMAKNE
jgi:hypothetical protein